jgi:DNA-binding transcriptional LysR family regulator
MRWSLNDVPAFVAVVEQSGITAAARRLEMSKSTVSQSITRLEAALGVRLLERNSRAVRVTREGQAFYDKALLILEQAQEADAVISGLTEQPSGRLSVAAAPAFTQEYIAPRIAEFKRAYPDIDLVIKSTVRRGDFIADGFDIAVVVGEHEDSDLIVKKLWSGRLIWVSSPEYATRLAPNAAVEHVTDHVQVCESRYAQRKFPVHLHGRQTSLDLYTGVTKLTDPLAVRAAILAGAGVAPLPERYCHSAIEGGQLVEVFTEIECDHSAAALSVIYPSKRLTSPRIRAFLTFLDQIGD